MRDAVREQWLAFNEPLEGRTNWMYCDTAEPVPLVTTGCGNLIDPMTLATALPWKRQDGSKATYQEVVEAWRTVKYHPISPDDPKRGSPESLAARKAFAKRGGGHYAALTTLRLTQDFVDSLVRSKLDQNDGHMSRRWKDYPDWPADAQLAILSWAWAVGPHAKYPRMSAALDRSDFAAAADECRLAREVGTAATRFQANRRMLVNAAHVIEARLDPSVLYWPSVVMPPDTMPPLDVA